MDKQEVKRLADKHGLIIDEEKIKINESGMDFLVAHVVDKKNNQWILRIPRREDSMTRSKQEHAVLEVLYKHTGIKAPHWKVFTNDCMAYKQLDGLPAGTIDHEIQNYVWSFDKESDLTRYHETLGATLAELHRTPISYVEDTGIKIFNSSQAKEEMSSRMNKVKEIYGVSDELWARWQKWLANDHLWPNHTGLLHGDVHPGHILVNKEKEVTGLIDWTEVAVGDVSIDFTSHYLIFGGEGLDVLISAYEKAGGRTWPFMKEHIIELVSAAAVGVAEFAQLSGLEEMEKMAKTMLGVDGENHESSK
ncbi:macrolide 2'-phosphotransferase [Cytobacillus sp. Sa5YUA1]|uniref:Macrolide 2'-phosphotransferase n=1 Tax=Cytobacillus stercorigallinarum TaxID=2762240 RepID=A0ABR8QTU8_9BACI|nr:macrolide 2'-phosphotransferase [Cytobacillus stercorigallinarum]MBD7938958.1 macrolide 2'-phosphotransferase [Cytobacillus stercorigallinarum]